MTPFLPCSRIRFKPLWTLAVVTSLGVGTCVLPSAHAAGEAAGAAAHPVVGTWNWPVFGGKCVETFQYRPNGTLLSTSGEAVTEWTYEIAATPSDRGFYKVVESSLRQNGKRDCSGDVLEKEGDVNTRYIQFSPARDRLIFCKSESLAACFGPLVKIE